jgi:hypothetical protein
MGDGLRLRMKPGPDGAEWFVIEPEGLMARRYIAVQLLRNGKGQTVAQTIRFDDEPLDTHTMQQYERAVSKAVALMQYSWEQITQLVLNDHARSRRQHTDPWNRPTPEG